MIFPQMNVAMKPQVLDRGSLKNLPVGQIVMGTAQLWHVLLIHGMKYEKQL